MSDQQYNQLDHAALFWVLSKPNLVTALTQIISEFFSSIVCQDFVFFSHHQVKCCTYEIFHRKLGVEQ